MMENPPSSQSKTRHNRIICVPFSPEEYLRIISDANAFRSALNERIGRAPELFPATVTTGYRLKDITHSQKLTVPIRRILISGISDTIRPSYLMPYMTGLTDTVEKALFFRKCDVPYWALSYGFGRNPLSWYRQEQALGRTSLVGTTRNPPDALPEHILVDEKHTTLLGEKVSVATTVAQGCILGAAVAESAGETDLTKAYGTFKTDAQQLQADYAPRTVNTDGWKATQHALKPLFPSLTFVLCFLHVDIKIRDRATKKMQEVFLNLSTTRWDAYHADTTRSFSQRIRRLHEWALRQSIPDVLIQPVEKVRQNLSAFTCAFEHPGAYRTSNMLDRLMQRMDRHLFSTQYFHGTRESADQHIRAWALLMNVTPSNPVTVNKHHGQHSPAERINHARYHDNWLQNLLISASLGGYRDAPLNPL